MNRDRSRSPWRPGREDNRNRDRDREDDRYAHRRARDYSDVEYGTSSNDYRGDSYRGNDNLNNRGRGDQRTRNNRFDNDNRRGSYRDHYDRGSRQHGNRGRAGYIGGQYDSTRRNSGDASADMRRGGPESKRTLDRTVRFQQASDQPGINAGVSNGFHRGGPQDHGASNRGDGRGLAQNNTNSAKTTAHQQPQVEDTIDNENTAEARKPVPDVDMDFEPQPVVQLDEEALRAARRAHRAKILAEAKAKAAAAAAGKEEETPLLKQVLVGSASGPASPSVSASVDRSGTSAEPMDTDSPGVASVDGNGSSQEGNDRNSPQEMNASAYDPAMDRERDEAQAEAQAKAHPDTNAEIANTKQASKSKKEYDMFATDPPDELLEQNSVSNQSSSPNISKKFDDRLMTAWDDEQGYYIIRRGEVIQDRYVVGEDLGRGTFSEVVYAWDRQEGRKVAIKIVRSGDAMRATANREYQILTRLNDNDPTDSKNIVRVLNRFDHKRHLCLVFEHLDMSVRGLLKKEKHGMSMENLRHFARRIFIALEYLREREFLHADFKPDNLLYCEDDKHRMVKLKVCDLGSALEPFETFGQKSDVLVSRFYRPPEIILGIQPTFAIDMWSVGCTLFELWTGKICFTGASNNQMLRMMMEALGAIPMKLARKGDNCYTHFNLDGSFRSFEVNQIGETREVQRVIKHPLPKHDIRSRVKQAAANWKPAPSEKELASFVDLLGKCLSFNPDRRIKPTDALNHPWFDFESPKETVSVPLSTRKFVRK